MYYGERRISQSQVAARPSWIFKFSLSVCRYLWTKMGRKRQQFLLPSPLYSLFLVLCDPVLRNSFNPARWFKQIKRTVSFDETTRLLLQSKNLLRCTILTYSTILTQLTHCKYREVLLLSLRKAVFLHYRQMYSKSSHSHTTTWEISAIWLA